MELSKCVIRILCISAATTTLHAANPTPTIKGNSHSGPPSPEYKLVWADEFDGSTLDKSKWKYRGLGKRRDAINSEDCVALDGDGHLVITTKVEAKQVHTGMIATDGLADWTFGYFECRAKMQKEKGDWSAFWMQSNGNKAEADPVADGAEIDIYEYFKHVGAGIIDHAVLWSGYGKTGHSSGAIRRKVEGLDDGFHTFGFEWTESQYVFYVDGVESWRTKTAVSHHSEYIILSMEALRRYGLQENQLPDSVTFDYVRVYQKPGVGKQVHGTNK